MPDRRTALSQMAFGGMLMTLEPAVQDSAAERETLARAIAGFRDEIARQSTFWEIAPVRDQFRTFLRTTGKFPDFIEVGSDIWQQIYDWHVRYGQPIALGRTADGRYTIALMMTTAILRPDLAPSFVGAPYDSH